MAESLADVAKTVRKTILQLFENSEKLAWPPTAEYLQNLQGTVPGELQRFLKIVRSGKEKENVRPNGLSLSIGQDICRTTTT